MIDKLEIREANFAHIPSILGLYAQKDIDDGNILSPADAISIFNRFKSYPNYNLYVALDDNKVVGTFALLIMDNLAHMGKPSGVVEDVVVDSNLQSQGIGKKMMEAAMQICKKHDCYKLTLSSSIHRERAHRFYENLGFEKHGYSFLIALK